MNPTKYIGVDLSKLELIVAFSPTAKAVAFANNAEGYGQLIKKLPSGAHVVCESTGGYQRGLVRALQQAGVPVSVVMPVRVRAFAKARGLRAKTDPIDARLLSAYGEAMALRAPTPPSEEQQQLQQLLRARQSLVSQLNDEASLAEHCTLPLLQEQAKERKALLRAQIRQIEQRLREMIRANALWRWRMERAQEVTGIGEVSAWTVLADMPELGQLQQGQAGALLGVAPDPDDSGQRRGRRHISGGRSYARKVLYMAAVTASQKNPILAPFYRRLVLERNKPARVALTAIMRKLAELLNRMFADTNFKLAT